MIVLDASAVLELLLRTEAGRRIEDRLLSPSETLHAPHLLDVEVLQVLRRYCAAGDMEEERGREAIEDFAALPIARYPHHLFLERIWQLKQNMSAYDAAYVALAEALPAPLVTCDGRLAAAAGHGATIELVRA